METDETDVGGKQDPRESNVVRFPRDWLGPLDELVPLGPAGGQESDSSPADSSPGDGRVVDFTPPAPREAADFWGEDAAAFHDAVEPPPESATAVRDGGASHGRVSSRRSHLPAIPRRFGYRVAGPREASRGRRRAVLVAAVSAAAVTLVGLALAVGLFGGTAGPQTASRGRLGGFTSTPFASLPSDVIALGRLGQRHVQKVSLARRHRRSTPVTSARKRSFPAPRAVSPAPSPVYTRTQPTPSPAPSTETSRPVVAESTPVEHSSTGGSSGSASTTHTSAPTTSSTRPAFGANGLLGPGSSPNS